MLLEIFWIYFSCLTIFLVINYIFLKKYNLLWIKFFSKLFFNLFLVLIVYITTVIWAFTKNCFSSLDKSFILNIKYQEAYLSLSKGTSYLLNNITLSFYPLKGMPSLDLDYLRLCKYTDIIRQQVVDILNFRPYNSFFSHKINQYSFNFLNSADILKKPFAYKAFESIQGYNRRVLDTHDTLSAILKEKVTVFNIIPTADSFVPAFRYTAESVSNNGLQPILFRLSILTLLFVCFCIVLLLTQKEKNINVLLLMFFSFCGFIMVFCSMTWIQLLLAFELATFPLFVLIAAGAKTLVSFEGAIKYFVISSIMTILFLIAITVAIKNNIIFLSWVNEKILETGTFFENLINSIILAYLLGKLPFFPLQKAVIDAYSVTRKAVLTYILLFPKITVLFIIINIINNHNILMLSPIIFVSIIITMGFSTIFAFFQTTIKKFIVYTSIFHNAFFISLILANNNYCGIYLTISLALYALIICIFILLLSMLKKSDNTYIDNFNSLQAISNSYHAITNHLLFAIVSMAGIPPFAGFFMKYYIINVFLYNSLFFITGLLLVLSIPVLYTYLRMAQILYLKTKQQKKKNILLHSSEFSLTFIISLLQIVNIMFIKFGYTFILFFEIML